MIAIYEDHIVKVRRSSIFRGFWDVTPPSLEFYEWIPPVLGFLDSTRIYLTGIEDRMEKFHRIFEIFDFFWAEKIYFGSEKKNLKDAMDFFHSVFDSC